jgi:hypothetical protein
MLESTNATGEGKNTNVFLDVWLCLKLKLDTLPPMHQSRLNTDTYISQTQIFQILESYVKSLFTHTNFYEFNIMFNLAATTNRLKYCF